jgi:hypothetical protein
MDILLNSEFELGFSWHPGCIFEGISSSTGKPKYMRGCVGRIGPGMSTEDIKKQVWEKPNVPSSLVFTINFKNQTDGDLYRKISGVLKEMENTDQIEVTCSAPRKVRDKIGVKDEYKEKSEEANNKNKEINEKLMSLVGQLEELGCTCDDLGSPKYEKILDEWFDWNEYENAKLASINICCHNETQFYGFMQENGIFEKYFPEWYAKGNF